VVVEKFQPWPIDPVIVLVLIRPNEIEIPSHDNGHSGVLHFDRKFLEEGS
jgi:hypothetical protein